MMKMVGYARRREERRGVEKLLLLPWLSAHGSCSGLFKLMMIQSIGNELNRLEPSYTVSRERASANKQTALANGNLQCALN